MTPMTHAVGDGRIRRSGLLLLLMVLVLSLNAGCGGGNGDNDGAPSTEFGVKIDQSSPQATAVSYLKLIDTCSLKAAERAFELILKSDEYAPREQVIQSLEGVAGDELYPPSVPYEDRPPLAVQHREERKLAERLFSERGACDRAGEVPVKDIMTAVFAEQGVVPDFGDPDGDVLPPGRVLVLVRGGDCDGDDNGFALTQSAGRWLIDADVTDHFLEDNEIEGGCVKD